jgi:hypothetical protein
LDEPFPANLPVVGTCGLCNRGASLDEEYVACLIEVAACGSANPDSMERPRIRRALARKPALAARFDAALDPKAVAVAAETDRIRRVVEKTARGLWAYELAEPALDLKADVEAHPLHLLDPETRAAFERISPPQIFAEVGSRMMIQQIRALGSKSVATSAGWQVVQPGRFRYAVEFDERSVVRLVLREYLAAEIQFGLR